MATLYRFLLKYDGKQNLHPNHIIINMALQKVVRHALSLTEGTMSLSVLSNSHLDLSELEQIKASLSEQQIEVESIQEEDMKLSTEADKEKSKPKKAKKKKPGIASNWWQGGIGTVWGVAILILSFFTANIPLLATYILSGLSSLLTLILGYDSYQGAFKKLVFSRKLTMDTLFAISTLTIVAVSIASFFVPGLPVMFEAAPLIFGLRHIGKAIEKSLKTKVLSDLKMRDVAAKEVQLIDELQGQRPFLVNDLIPNDIITVAPGQIIPVDGIALNSTTLYTTKITGSPFPSLYRPNNRILAGMKVAEDAEPIKIRVSNTAQRSYLARVDENIKSAHKEKADIEHVTDKILQFFIPTLLLAAISSGILIGIFFSPALAIQCAISVLVSACPCALGFITPLAVKVGMNKAAEKGINFKSGKTLQAAQSIDTVVFDLNGTLTTGKPEVSRFKNYGSECSDDECLKMLSLLESESNHPIAKAIVNYSRLKGIPPANKKITIDKTNHSGVKAIIDGDEWIVGNEKMLSMCKIPFNPNIKASAAQTIYLVKNKHVIADIKVHDPLRPDALATINELKKLGMKIHLCTGAAQNTAQHYANVLGIASSNVIGGCVGTEVDDGRVSKASYIENLKSKGHKVAMVGDAGNDVIAIAKSHFGIAIQSEASDEMTYQQAGAVIPSTSLLPVVAAFEVAKQAGRNIMQNLFVSLTYNTAVTLIAGGLLIAVGFTLNPALGIALMVLETSLVLANTYRFKMQSLAYTKNASYAAQHNGNEGK